MSKLLKQEPEQAAQLRALPSSPGCGQDEPPFPGPADGVQPLRPAKDGPARCQGAEVWIL